jgi:hypothetical protein
VVLQATSRESICLSNVILIEVAVARSAAATQSKDLYGATSLPDWSPGILPVNDFVHNQTRLSMTYEQDGRHSDDNSLESKCWRLMANS